MLAHSITNYTNIFLTNHLTNVSLCNTPQTLDPPENCLSLLSLSIFSEHF